VHVREGYFADLVLLDYGRAADSVTCGEPRRQPEGIEAVSVNGRPVFDHGAWAAQGAGRVLRR
jgi:N-acyl-D-amino-acid deacylase